MNLRNSGRRISLARYLSSSRVATRFIRSKVRSRACRNQDGGHPYFMRIVTWNIEKGKRWQVLERCFSHESIRTTDVLCLNEVDEGMARSGNLRIAYEIGERLGMQVTFGPTFREFTKGIS